MMNDATSTLVPALVSQANVLFPRPVPSPKHRVQRRFTPNAQALEASASDAIRAIAMGRHARVVCFIAAPPFAADLEARRARAGAVSGVASHRSQRLVPVERLHLSPRVVAVRRGRGAAANAAIRDRIAAALPGAEVADEVVARRGELAIAGCAARCRDLDR